MEKFITFLLLIGAVTIVQSKFDGDFIYKCCDQPKVIPETAFGTCVEKYGKKFGGPHGGPRGGPRGDHGPRDGMNGDPEGSPPIRGCCMAECAFNETNLYKGNGIVDQEATKSLFIKSTTDSEWQKIISKAVDDCFIKSADKMDDFNDYMVNGPQNNNPDTNDDNDKELCHPITGYIMKCVFGNMFINCPSEKYTDTERCNNMKERIEQCPDCGPKFG